MPFRGIGWPTRTGTLSRRQQRSGNAGSVVQFVPAVYILAKTTYKDWPIEIICLVGKPPPEWNDAGGTGREGVMRTLASVDARIVFYDELLTNAQQAYADFLEAHIKVDKLWGVFAAIDDFAPPPQETGAKDPPEGRSAAKRSAR